LLLVEKHARLLSQLDERASIDTNMLLDTSGNGLISQVERDGRAELLDKLDRDTYGLGNRQRAVELEQESVQRFEVNGAVGLAGFLVSGYISSCTTIMARCCRYDPNSVSACHSYLNRVGMGFLAMDSSSTP
jgi:hypothetical protein